MSTPAKPEDLLDPGHFPDDLKWVPAHYKLHPTDPVYLLIAWHWRRVKQSEDTLKATIVEIKKALDDRIGHLTEAAETVAGVNDALADVDAVVMRKDPPFDSEYFYATHLLEQAEREGARVEGRVGRQRQRPGQHHLGVAALGYLGHGLRHGAGGLRQAGDGQHEGKEMFQGHGGDIGAWA